jgi:hypothetical protein
VLYAEERGERGGDERHGQSVGERGFVGLFSFPVYPPHVGLASDGHCSLSPTMASAKPLEFRWGVIATGAIATKVVEDLLVDPKTCVRPRINTSVIAI